MTLVALTGALPAVTNMEAQSRGPGRGTDRDRAERIERAREDAARAAAARAEAARLRAARADSLRAEVARIMAARAQAARDDAARDDPAGSEGAPNAMSRAPVTTSAVTSAATSADRSLVDGGRYTVLIDLDKNQLYFKQGDVTLWSAPVGTGTGMRVITRDDAWEFSTPTGNFQVQYKERDPVWIAPDWFFVENNLPVPEANHPSRYMKGTLGIAAVYLSPDVAIHGTNRPELIGQRVSHGCIRLENRYALRLYHNVQVGTKVVIVGGEAARRGARTVDLRDGYDPSLASMGAKQPTPSDAILESWKAMDTREVIRVLDRELLRGSGTSRWDEAAVLLVQRANQGDDEAMAEILRRSVNLTSDRMRREWATFVAYLYRNEPIRTLEAMSGLQARDRREVARVLVSSTVTLYAGDLSATSAPWPTKRIPDSVVPLKGRRGWTALVAAESEHRDILRRKERGEAY